MRAVSQMLVALTTIALSYSVSAQQPTSPLTATKNDYRQSSNWLCRPDRKPSEADACNVDLTTTVIAADGSTSIEKWQANSKAGVDCFYVYPTVSLDATANSDMIAGREELSVVHQQFARFGSQCRVFAPLYRQITLPALQSIIAGKPMAMDMMLGYNDVVDSWNHYLEHDNQGRGVVLIGHSQGSSVLTQLIQKEIDGKPVQNKLVSALLLGWNVAVPKGKDVGGAFPTIPLCHAINQTGCVITYASFRVTSPPPANTRFGKVPGENRQSACVNPAAIGGGPGELRAYLSASSWTGEKVNTPFVRVPGMISGECVADTNASYLAVTLDNNKADVRPDDIAGDVISNGQVQKDWGLHLIDVNLSMGNLIDIVAEQGKTYLHNCPCKK